MIHKIELEIETKTQEEFEDFMHFLNEFLNTYSQEEIITMGRVMKEKGINLQKARLISEKIIRSYMAFTNKKPLNLLRE